MNKEKLINKVIRVKNETASRAVQEAFFKTGVFWLEGQEDYLSEPTLRYGDEAYLGYVKSFSGKLMGIRGGDKEDVINNNLKIISLSEDILQRRCRLGC